MASRTHTVVFTDLANYTASVGRTDRKGLRNLIAAHEKMVAPVLERHSGRVVKKLGDSFMALFDAATDAVRAGVDLIDSVSGEGDFSIRVSMATGDIEVIDGDVFGEAVNLASRIEGKTPAGEVWFSEATLHCMNQSEVAWEPVGRYVLKGIAGEKWLYRAVPTTMAWLPDPVVAAAREGRLVVVTPDQTLPAFPPRPLILLDGFRPGSTALSKVVDCLPPVDPACLWLVAYNIASSDRLAWLNAGRGLVIGYPAAVHRALDEVRTPEAQSTGSDTIILDVGSIPFVDVVISGLALPAVPISEVVAGYSYDLLPDGRWVNNSHHAVGRIDVSGDGVVFVPLQPGILMDGRQALPGQRIALREPAEFQTSRGVLRWTPLSDRTYLGLVQSDAVVRVGIGPGQQAEIGREPRHRGLALPDRRGQDNIRWCPGSRAAQARASGFTLDRALVGRRHGAVSMERDRAIVVSLHERCPTFVLRDGQVIPVRKPITVQTGDLLLAGTNVLAIREHGR